MATIQLVDKLNETFNKSAMSDLKNYLSKHNKMPNFILSSDYCIGDSKKKNDVISFLVIPNISKFKQYSETISFVAPRDLKNTKTISPYVKHLIQSDLIFVINFILPKGKSRILRNVPKNYISAAISQMHDMIDNWIMNEPEKIDQHTKSKQRIRALCEEHKKKSFNVNLFSDIHIISVSVKVVVT